jgi:hypothetical protein
VVGLYHLRCFVVVLSAVKPSRDGNSITKHLHALMSKPLEVTGQNAEPHLFVPRFSVGSVTVHAADAVPAQVIDEAEQLALASEREQRAGLPTADIPLL